MKHDVEIPLVQTIKERCRVCYTCVRECPAKAIRIADGQAEIIPQRCIGCGNCVRVCSQNAKQVVRSIDAVRELLNASAPVAAIIAPSFAAEFPEMPWQRLVGMIRALGFAKVNEVAFGADLVAARYRKLLAESGDERFIATSCPAIVAYVERYTPHLVDRLAPIVSPMIAEARVLKKLHGADLKIVFVGPCIAKKGEATSQALPAEIDAVLTFSELRKMFADLDIQANAVTPADFDDPQAGTGALFPISRGLLQAADIREDLVRGEVVTADGKGFVDAIKEFESGDMDVRLLEILCCQGCIMGAGMSTADPLFSRRAHISRYVRSRLKEADSETWQEQIEKFEGLDLSRGFTEQDQRIPAPVDAEISEVLARMGKFEPADELNCGACGYVSCREHAIAILKGMAESEMCLPYTIEQLRSTIKELDVSHDQLASAEVALRQSEKLASMGQLAAGIAHEVNNPLGVVLMYAHLLLDEQKDNPNVREDLEMIATQADRCKKIVAGLLHFARQNKVVLQETDMSDLIEKTLKAVPAPPGVKVKIVDESPDVKAEIDPDQITQVLTNLIGNAYSAMNKVGTLTIKTWCTEDNYCFTVADTGTGMTNEIREKIFEPFFTTKQIGMGTGLGLAVTYGIIKMHSGDISVESNADPSQGQTGTTFTVTLPKHPKTS